MSHMSYDITRLDVAATLRISTDVRAVAAGRQSLETAASDICGFFYDAFVDAMGERACALVRCYVSVRYADLPAEEQAFASRLLPRDTAPWPELRCLTLLGTRGDVDAWNDRRRSHGHRAIPLPSAATVEEAPMIAQLFKQMGASIADIVAPAPRMLAPTKRLYNVFHVADAKGSPHIPAQQEFVEPFGVRSVVGFGGVLSWGEMYSVILFSRAAIDAKSASRFRTIAIDVRSSLREFSRTQLFQPTSGSRAGGPAVAPTEPKPGPRETSIRTFSDARGVEWKAWAIIPSSAELSALGTERRNARFGLDESWEKGWLLFESSGESRRLRPIPDSWDTATIDELIALCEKAKPIRASAG